MPALASKPRVKKAAVSFESLGKIEKKVVAEKKKRLSAIKKHVNEQIVPDFPFNTPRGTVMLSDLFGKHDDLIVIHNMGKKCPYCTLWADGFTGLYKHLCDRAACVMASPDSPTVQREFAKSRGWPYKMVSVPSGGFAKLMGFEGKPGDFYPGVSAFHRKKNGVIVRTGAANFGPGDDFCALWPMFDLLKGGIGKWAPKYDYKASRCTNPACQCDDCTCGDECDCTPVSTCTPGCCCG